MNIRLSSEHRTINTVNRMHDIKYQLYNIFNILLNVIRMPI